jgi:hypothetical protein
MGASIINATSNRFNKLKQKVKSQGNLIKQKTFSINFITKKTFKRGTRL